MLKGTLAASAMGLRMPLARASDHTGRLLVFMHARGGWDPTSFCDPKENTRGEREISRWANNVATPVDNAGRIQYANVGGNAKFFQKHYRRMLVINGIDVQTNGHGTGEAHSSSGSNTGAYPSLTALFAARHGAERSMPYITFGGYSRTHGIVQPTRVGRPGGLLELAEPLKLMSSDDSRKRLHDYVVERSQVDRDALLNMTPSERRNRIHFAAVFSSVELNAFVDSLPDRLSFDGVVRPQAEVAVHAFKTGVAVSADLTANGFDTHANHDEDQRAALDALTDGVDYLWDYAETHGVAHRLTVVIGSELGRTNFYNDGNGKDHWPITSFIVMENGASWTNRVVGRTDGLHFAQRIDPISLRPDDKQGVVIHPRHVHQALRHHLEIDGADFAEQFPFNRTEDVAFFGRA